MDIYQFLVISHIIGTVLGVGGATFAEIFYVKAQKDGIFDPTESSWLKITYAVLRTGLVIAVLSGFGFLLFYRLTGQEELIFDPQLWAKMTVILVLVANALLLQMKKIPMWLGASLSLTSWYTALIIGSWRSLDASYVMILLVYAIAVVIVAFILEFIRRVYLKPRT